MSFVLHPDLLGQVVKTPSPYDRLRAAYRAAVADQPQLADHTLAAIRQRLQTDPALRSRQELSSWQRARLLRAFLEADAYAHPELRRYAGLPSYDSLWQMRRPLVLAGLLTADHRRTVLTPAGEAWLLGLVVPGSLEP